MWVTIARRLVVGALLATFGFLGMPSTASAFSEDIHRLIGQAAYDSLPQATQDKIKDLIKADMKNRYPGCEVNSLADAAAWPDCVKRVSLVNPKTHKTSKPYLWTKPMHYQDALFCEAFDPNVGCPNGLCVSKALTKYVAILKDTSRPDIVRLQALEFVAHFVGDAHQPLHATDNLDTGGNFTLVTPGGNLHSYWDGLAPRAALKAAAPAGGQLDGLKTLASHVKPAGGPNDYLLWLTESHAAGTLAYTTLSPAQTCKAPPNSTLNLSADWQKASIKTAGARVAEASVRLANLLQATL